MGKIEVIPDMISPLEIDYDQLETRFDEEHGISWMSMQPQSVPCFNKVLLKELRQYHESMEYCDGMVWKNGEFHSVNYLVYGSSVPGVFNLGGQLSLFRELIRRRDRQSLEQYARMCIDAMDSRLRHCGLSAITISLVQGDALGGGFEAALTSDVIIAERGCKMGFPEILFNLFPGMGAYSFLARKVGPALAEKMVLSGKLYSAEDLFAMGVVDVLADEGEGEEAVYEYIRKQERRSNGYMAVQKVKHRYNPVSYQELMDITSIWVDAALQLTEKDLKVMERFVRSQQKQFDKAVIPNKPRTLELPKMTLAYSS